MFKTCFISSKTREGKKVIQLEKHNVDGNKAKGRISKRLFQESKPRQIFRKTNISYPLIRTRRCAYQGVRNVRFSGNLACFVFLKHSFWDSPFYLITDELWKPVARRKEITIRLVINHLLFYSNGSVKTAILNINFIWWPFVSTQMRNQRKSYFLSFV